MITTKSKTLLMSYELVPEAYQLKVRATKMSENKSHVEFIRRKSEY